MSTSTESPTIVSTLDNDPDVEALRQATEEYAQGKRSIEDPLELPSEKQQATQDKDKPATETDEEHAAGKQKPDNSESDADKRARDEKGRFAKQETKTAEDKQPQVSEYEQKKAEKKAKEKERQDRSWESINRQKEELERQRQEIAQYQAQVAQTQQQQAPPKRRVASQEMYEAAQEFDRRAEQAIADGDFEKAKENRNLVRQALGQVQKLRQIEAQEVQQYQAQQFQGTWTAYMEQSIQEEPELGKPDSAISKEVQAIMSDQRIGAIFDYLPNGFPLAVELAKLRLESASASELKGKVTKLESELAEAHKKLGLAGSGPHTPPAPKKSLDEMSTNDALKELQRLSELADQGIAA